MARSISALLVCVAVGALVAACGGGGSSSKATTPSASTETVVTAGTKLPAGCTKVTDPGPREAETNQKRPTGRLSGPATVVMQTNCGTFTITLDTERAPRTTASFATLVKRGFYDALQFHRVGTDTSGKPFVIQGGDPLTTGLGGPGYTIKEKPPSDLKYTKYTVAMARTATEPSGTSGSQFFVVTAPDAGLSPSYALVGKVTSGKDAIDRISKVPANGNESPIAPIVIQKATLQGGTLSGT